ncbi:MAG: hypothetical protein EOP09_07950 [Proteobacteria bacterium]|nr:MAG: hypothetical protein EOP09_07950 [Pseudomonadota bacterium]
MKIYTVYEDGYGQNKQVKIGEVEVVKETPAILHVNYGWATGFKSQIKKDREGVEWFKSPEEAEHHAEESLKTRIGRAMIEQKRLEDLLERFQARKGAATLP